MGSILSQSQRNEIHHKTREHKLNISSKTLLSRLSPCGLKIQPNFLIFFYFSLFTNERNIPLSSVKNLISHHWKIETVN